MKTFYQITKNLRGETGPNQDIPVKTEDGTTITEETAKLERWREHLKKILRGSNPLILPDIDEADKDLEIETGRIKLSEEDAVCLEMQMERKHPTCCSASVKIYGLKVTSQMTGRKESLLSCPRKVTLETAATCVGTHYSPLPAKFSAA